MVPLAAVEILPLKILNQFPKPDVELVDKAAYGKAFLSRIKSLLVPPPVVLLKTIGLTVPVHV